MARRLFIPALAFLALALAAPAAAQDNGGGATGGMGSIAPVVPSDQAGAVDAANAARSKDDSAATDGSSIRGGSSFHHRAKPGPTVPAASVASTLAEVAGGTIVLDPRGATVGLVSGRLKDRGGQVLGLQVKLASGPTITIPAAQLSLAAGKLITTYAIAK